MGSVVQRTGASAINNSGGGGSGDVVGPSSATDNAIVRFDTTTGKLVQNSGVTISDAGTISSSQSLTGSQTDGAIDLTPTWNTTGLPTALRINVTDTASSSSSLLLNLLVGGSSRLSLRKDGFLQTANNIHSSANIGVNTASGFFFLGASADVQIARDAAQILAQRNGTNAQTFRLYGTYTDASNGDWLNITKAAGGAVTISTAANGTGTAGAINITSGTGGGVTITSPAGQNLTLNGGANIIFQLASVQRGFFSAIQFALTPTTSTSAATGRFAFTAAADTALTASAEAVAVIFDLSAIRQHATGALTLQRDMRIRGSTHSFVAASTLTDSATLSVEYGNGGTNATVTNLSALYVPTAALSNTTNGYGLNVAAPTGATRNYAARFAGPVQYQNYTVATLPTVAAYTRAFVTDANATTFNSIVVGGGANVVPVFYDGTNWRIG